jgi:hypothetical protein
MNLESAILNNNNTPSSPLKLLQIGPNALSLGAPAQAKPEWRVIKMAPKWLVELSFEGSYY